jgi:hypothetical protein
VQAAFHFTSLNGGSAGKGWYVDDISLAGSPTPPPTLTISVTNGVRLAFNTVSNATWRIDASTNLLNWLPLLTNTAGPSGTIQFIDLLATNYPRRFYRAVLQ